MTLALLFLLGIANFAMHKAVLESGHPIVAQMAWMRTGRFGSVSLVLEYVVLFTAMLFAANGWTGVVWIYLIYSGANALSAWLLLSGRA